MPLEELLGYGVSELALLGRVRIFPVSLFSLFGGWDRRQRAGFKQLHLDLLRQVNHTDHGWLICFKEITFALVIGPKLQNGHVLITMVIEQQNPFEQQVALLVNPLCRAVHFLTNSVTQYQSCPSSLDLHRECELYFDQATGYFWKTDNVV